MIEDHDLDALLASPLAEIADDGFSARLAARIATRAWWRERLALFAPVAAVAAVAPFLPLDEFTATALRLTPMLANSAALAIAVAALALTLAFERFREAQTAL